MRALTMLFMKNVTNFIDDMHSHHLAAFAVRAANAVISTLFTRQPREDLLQRLIQWRFHHHDGARIGVGEF